MLIRTAERRSARGAANLLLSARLAPELVAFLAVGLIFTPVYAWFEAGQPAERVGLPFVAVAFAGAAVTAASLVVRGLRVVLDSSRYIRYCERVSKVTQVTAHRIARWPTPWS